MNILKSYSEGQSFNYFWRFSVLFTKYFHDFLFESDQVISPFNIIKLFFPRENLKSVA